MDGTVGMTIPITAIISGMVPTAMDNRMGCTDNGIAECFRTSVSGTGPGMEAGMVEPGMEAGTVVGIKLGMDSGTRVPRTKAGIKLGTMVGIKAGTQVAGTKAGIKLGMVRGGCRMVSLVSL